LCFLDALFAVSFHKLIDPACGIDEFLLASKKGMAFGTNLYPDVRLSGTSMNSFSAGANDYAIFVIGMNLVFHIILLEHLKLWSSEIPTNAMSRY
jgi:hypothetical protein